MAFSLNQPGSQVPKRPCPYFANPDAQLRLSADVLIEDNDGWRDSDRRHLSEECWRCSADLPPPRLARVERGDVPACTCP